MNKQAMNKRLVDLEDFLRAFMYFSDYSGYTDAELQEAVENGNECAILDLKARKLHGDIYKRDEEAACSK